MTTTTADAKLTSTRALAQYAARTVNDTVRQQLRSKYPGAFISSSTSPFDDYEYERYNTDTGWSTFKRYNGAEELLRELAVTTADQDILRFVAKITSPTKKSVRARISFHRHIADENPRINVINDGQRKHVYRAEYGARVHKLDSFEASESFIHYVVRQDWWQDRMGRLREGSIADRVVVSLKSGNNKASAWWHRREVKLPKSSWAYEKTVCLHELAHLLAPADEEHGPVFTACHVLLVRTFVDDESADKLRAAYLSGGVKIATDETLEAMFELRRTQGATFLLASLDVKVDYVKRTRATRA